MFNALKLYLKYKKYLPAIMDVIEAIQALIEAIQKKDDVAINAHALELNKAAEQFIPDNVAKVATKAERAAFIATIGDSVRAVTNTIKTAVELFRE